MEDGIRRVIGPRSYIRVKREFNLKEIVICQEYENTIQELEDVISGLKTDFLINKHELTEQVEYQDLTIESLNYECDRLDDEIKELGFVIENLKREIRQGD